MLVMREGPEEAERQWIARTVTLGKMPSEAPRWRVGSRVTLTSQRL